MSDNKNFYEGREHSEVKHNFVGSYLKVLTIKLAMSGYTTINYVDGLAGPWNNRDEEDLTDTSFVTAINQLEEVRKYAASRNKEIEPRYLLCEKNTTAFNRLSEFANSRKELFVKVFRGEFEDNLNEINDFINPERDFTLTFVDPKGWKIDSKRIFDFLRKQKNGEVLLNFMSDPINRHAAFKDVEASFGLFLGNSNWRADFDALSEEKSNEEKILKLFKKKLKIEKVAEFCPDMPIRQKDQERTKMRLLLGTRSGKGVLAFREVQKKEQKKEQDRRDKRAEQRSGQFGLFDSKALEPDDPRIERVGSKGQLKKAEKWVIDKLSVNKIMTFEKLSPYIMSEAAITEPDLKKVLKDMKKREQITYELPSKKRVPQPSTVIRLGAGIVN